MGEVDFFGNVRYDRNILWCNSSHQATLFYKFLLTPSTASSWVSELNNRITQWGNVDGLGLWEWQFLCYSDLQ
jgi:hypothetical protein